MSTLGGEQYSVQKPILQEWGKSFYQAWLEVRYSR